MGSDHTHRVCTYAEAEEAIRSHKEIYINDCFCRLPAKMGETSWEYCGHPIETCMGFHKPAADASFESRRITQEEALDLFETWREAGNLFRFMEDESWICFCCSCGCQWFRDKEGNRVEDTCEKSPWIERTDLESCNLCGDCIDLCSYEARSIAGDEMRVDSSRCYGCSACESACPIQAITMVAR